MKRKILPKQKMSRKSRDDGDATTAKIIEAAGRLFAERGYAGTSNKDIAERAKTSVTSINYHFGSREVLYEVVSRKACEDIFNPDFFERLENSTASAWDRLRSFVGYVTDCSECVECADYPNCSLCSADGWQIKLWAREMVEPSPLWLRMNGEILPPKLAIVLTILSEATGIPAGAPELEVCLLSILSPVVFVLMANPVNQWLSSPAGPLDIVAAAENLREFILAGVERMAETYSRRRSPELASPSP